MPDTKRAAVEWSAVATAWDTHIDYVDEHTIAATEALLDQVAVQPGERVLELAAGPGSLGEHWSRLVGTSGSVMLSDIAEGMVEVARTRNASLDNVDFAVIDAAAIDAPDGCFEVVACRMGLMFAPEPSIAFGEIHRVLAPGGRLGALTWAGIEHNPWMTCVGMAAMMNGLVTGGPPVGPGDIFSLGDPDQLAELAKGAGFLDVTIQEIDVDFEASDISNHISRITSLAGPLAAILESSSADQRAELQSTAAELAAPYAGDAGFVIPGRALLVSARS